MNATKIEGANKVFVAEGCNNLDVREVSEGMYYTLESAWIPTPEELALLNAGRPLVLVIAGRGMPPVKLEVRP